MLARAIAEDIVHVSLTNIFNDKKHYFYSAFYLIIDDVTFHKNNNG